MFELVINLKIAKALGFDLAEMKPMIPRRVAQENHEVMAVYLARSCPRCRNSFWGGYRRTRRNGIRSIRSLRPLPRRVTATLSSLRSPRAACSSVGAPRSGCRLRERPTHRLRGLDPNVGGVSGRLQDYSQLIVFENQAAMDKLKRNEIHFGANASAVYADTGAAMSAQFVDGVAVFVRLTRGAMAEASLGGQQITYLPK
jgi:hypothetical protein